MTEHFENITAIILCGGKGERLRPLTKTIPKPLVELNNKPILFYIINHMLNYKIRKFIIATGYKSDKIEVYMKRNFKDIDYKIVNSGDVDIIKRLKNCMSNDNESDYLVAYGDTITNIDLKKLLKFQGQSYDNFTMSSYPITIPFGVIDINHKGIVKKFTEKPMLRECMNIGYYVIPRKLTKYLFKFSSFLSFLKTSARNSMIKSYRHKGIHITINTLSELNEANNNIKKVLTKI